MRTSSFTVFLIVVLCQFALAGRYYDARTARFLQIDPRAHKYPSWSGYSYSLSNPLKFIDPDGKDVELIIGKPYIKSGTNYPYGHMALRLFNKNVDIVFDFGRYGRTWGWLDQYGEGVLNVRNSQHYINAEKRDRSSVGFVFSTSEEQDKKILGFFNGLIQDKGSRELYRIDSGTGRRIKLAKGRDYHWSDNNCVTITIEALEAAGIYIFQEGTYKPMNALEQLEEKETKKHPDRVNPYGQDPPEQKSNKEN